MNKRKLLEKALTQSRNLRFTELKALVEAFGFHLDRVRGSHHIFRRAGILEMVNIQDCGGMAKA